MKHKYKNGIVEAFSWTWGISMLALGLYFWLRGTVGLSFAFLLAHRCLEPSCGGRGWGIVSS